MKTPLFHLQYEIEEDETYTEAGTDKGAKLTVEDIADRGLRELLLRSATLSLKDALKWFNNNRKGTPEMTVLPLTSYTPTSLRYRLGDNDPKLLVVTRSLHTIPGLDKYLYAASEKLSVGHYLWCHSMTAMLKRLLAEQRYPWGIRHIVIASQYMWHRVCPKLRLTRPFYFAVTKGKNRTFSRVEILGRLYRAGFEVVDEQFRYGEFFVIARKAKAPINDTAPTGSPIIHLRRHGKGGKDIVVHKFRTMYTYSEYIQSYIYQYQNLQNGGKFKDDYRINCWGRLLRKVWLDELPMVWNILQGDMKLVGVRPLSHQYFSLYAPEMQELRNRVKPGLLPPFYYDKHTPETIEEVQESERRYLEAYLRAPFRTDWRYFWGIVGNIIFNRKRSK